MLNINDFATNEKAELSGVWKCLEGETHLLVARARNSNYKKIVAESLAVYGTTTLLHKLSEDEQLNIICKAMSEAILLDWKGLADETGEARYSTEKAFEWLKKYKEFRKIVSLLSEDVDNFRDENIKELKEKVKK